MSRKNNKDRNGSSFSEQTKLAVWNKTQVVSGYDSSKTRKDHCNAWIKWDSYGDTIENGYGWEIDHIKPVSKGAEMNYQIFNLYNGKIIEKKAMIILDQIIVRYQLSKN